AALGILLWVFFFRSTFSTREVRLELAASGEARSGSVVSVTVRYRNGSKELLRNAELVFRYPVRSFPTEPRLSQASERPQVRFPLGSLGEGSEGEKTFSFLFLGEVGEIKNFEAVLSYEPGTRRYTLENRTQREIRVSGETLTLHIEGPERAIASDPVEYRLKYKNDGDVGISEVRVVADLPTGFSLVSAVPEAEEHGPEMWLLGDLSSGEEGELKIAGKLSGSPGEAKTIRASIGSRVANDYLPFKEVKFSTELAPAFLSLAVLANGSADPVAVDPGANIRYTIRFKNGAAFPLRELVLQAQLSGEMIDLGAVNLFGGSFSSQEERAVWSGGNIPTLKELRPGEEGSVEFDLRLRESYPVRSLSDKNFRVTLKAAIDTPTVPPGVGTGRLHAEAEYISKVNSRLDLSALGYFTDPIVTSKSSGPIPPKVNQTTTYFIHWRIGSPANDIDEVLVRSVLPPNVSWGGNQLSLGGAPPAEYNARTNTVSWRIRRLASGTGVVRGSLETIFRVALTPSVSEVSQVPVIFAKTEAEGRDAFTGKELATEASEIPASLPDDPSVEQGIVVP
ncbi:hypothetical protein HYV98_01825, partial [Candidatus Azambacteria bacterium]|nr:hypothetical protein [Candidatus Azambacteria bacterium]